MRPQPVKRPQEPRRGDATPLPLADATAGAPSARASSEATPSPRSPSTPAAEPAVVLELPRPKLPKRSRGKKNASASDLWRYTAGDHGYAVTVFEKRGRRSLYIKWWDAKAKRIEKASLHHEHREKAIVQARRLSDELRLGAESRRAAPAVVTVEYLLEAYYREHGRRLTGTQPAEHLRRKRLWLGFLASRSRQVTLPEDLDDSLLQEFITVRRHGDLEVHGIDLPEPAPPATGREKRKSVVEDSTIDSDLVYLAAALNWASKRKENGRKLLAERPVDVPRVKSATQRQPVAAEEDLEALHPVVEAVDPQGLLGFWLDLENGLGWRVSGLSAVQASDLDFAPQFGAPHGRVRKNPLVDKENRDDWVPLTLHLAAVFRALLARRGLAPGDDASLFPAPNGGGKKPWSRFHVRDLIERAERAAGIAHIGGLHAWRRKWHTERKSYPAADVAKAAGYADVRSVDRYRKADPETTYEVMANPTHRVRRSAPTTGTDTPAVATKHRSPMVGSSGGASVSEPGYRAPTRRRAAGAGIPRLPAAGVGQGMGSAACSVMPDGTVVDSRDERFVANLAVARAYAAEHGHLMPNKRERPAGVNLLQWLKNQEIRIAKGTMPRERLAQLAAIPQWHARSTSQGTTETASGV